MSRLRVAIGEQLKTSPFVVTLGVRQQMADYTRSERELLRAADTIFYPTTRFVDLFATLEKETFPSVNCYRLQGARLKQTGLLRLLNVPHPRTRVYYGHKQKREILKDFSFPFVAKKPFGSDESDHAFLINDQKKLDWYNQHYNPAYIQEYISAEHELRLVVINYHTVFGYGRASTRGDFREAWEHRGAWRPHEVDPEGVELAKNIARGAGLSCVAVDVVFSGSVYRVVELNFYVDETDFSQGVSHGPRLIMEMIEKGDL